jgi:hypothetical protein
MPGFVWADPNNFANKYYAMSLADPNVPAGYIQEGGSDGAPDRDVQIFKPGAASGGYPDYGSASLTSGFPIIDGAANIKTALIANSGSLSPSANNDGY